MKRNAIIGALLLLLLAGSLLAAGPHVLVDIVDVVTKIKIGGGSYLTTSNQAGAGDHIVMESGGTVTNGNCLVGNAGAWMDQSCPAGGAVSGSLNSDFSPLLVNANTTGGQTLKSYSFPGGTLPAGASWSYKANGLVLAVNTTEVINICWDQSVAGQVCGSSVFQQDIHDGSHTNFQWDFEADCGTTSSGNVANCHLNFHWTTSPTVTPSFLLQDPCNPSGSTCLVGANPSGAMTLKMSVSFGTASASNLAWQESQLVMQTH